MGRRHTCRQYPGLTELKKRRHRKTKPGLTPGPIILKSTLNSQAGMYKKLPVRRVPDHMVKFLSKEFGVAPSDIEVVFGRMNVTKQLRIKNPRKLPQGLVLPQYKS